jgi:hypothetical protein
MKSIINFLSNNTVQVSAVNAGIWLSALDWSIKIVFGLPTAIYICFKLYHEFLKPDQKNNDHENNHSE